MQTPELDPKLAPDCRIMFIILSVLWLVACAADPGPAGDEPGEAPETSGENVAAMRDHALRDLGQRLNIPTRDIQVLSAEAVTWPDGAMGCPQPGFAYTDALMPGVLVVLAHGQNEYHFHGGELGRPLLCPPEYRRSPLGRSAGAALE